MRRTRPDFRLAAQQRLSDERGVSFAVSGLLSPDAPSPATVQVVSIDRLLLHPDIDAAESDASILEELIDSVRDLGVLSPILARATIDGSRLEILDGVRRWRAARAAGHTVVPVIVHDMDDETAGRFVALGRRRRPIPYARLIAATLEGAGPREPIVISGGDLVPSS